MNSGGRNHYGTGVRAKHGHHEGTHVTDGADKVISRYAFHKLFTVVLPGW
jgi:hypothetical protein